jgi:hypothetical protein
MTSGYHFRDAVLKVTKSWNSHNVATCLLNSLFPIQVKFIFCVPAMEESGNELTNLFLLFQPIVVVTKINILTVLCWQKQRLVIILSSKPNARPPANVKAKFIKYLMCMSRVLWSRAPSSSRLHIHYRANHGHVIYKFDSKL